MARIERRFDLASTLVDKKFLIRLLRIINSFNPKEIYIKTEIIVSSEQEKSNYENLRDFIDSEMIPLEIKRLSVKKTPYNKRDKERVIEFFISFDQDPVKSYYQLMGYDDGRLSSAKKKLDLLLDEYRNWYDFFFYPYLSTFEDGIKIGTGISFGIIIYQILNFMPWSYNLSMFGGFVGFLIGVNYLNKSFDKLFPFQDFQIRKIQRFRFLRSTFITVVTGLIINLTWHLIKWLILKN